MKSTALAAGSFVLGAICGVLGAMTLRHELWPLADRVGILRLYAGVGLALLVLFVGWYLRLQRRFSRALDPHTAQLFFSAANFFLVALLLGGAFALGLFFVVAH
ncbi:MAG: hypothetical protein QHJ34_06695 [bacterium]|jgi:hypothetical protein|nr:hypothetical protein [candidate division KSB1 bacterium]MDH7559905.1 hypothetical protein [bacterium]